MGNNGVTVDLAGATFSRVRLTLAPRHNKNGYIGLIFGGAHPGDGSYRIE
jgi:hypothetical protein